MPGLTPPHPVLFGEHVTHGRSSTKVLYVPAAQGVQVSPESVEPEPASQLPALAPPHPVSFAEHAVHAKLPVVVLYVPGPQAVHVPPGTVELDA